MQQKTKMFSELRAQSYLGAELAHDTCTDPVLSQVPEPVRKVLGWRRKSTNPGKLQRMPRKPLPYRLSLAHVQGREGGGRQAGG